MIHTQTSLLFHSSLCNFSASFSPSILEKIVNGPGIHKRHSTWTWKTDISPACTSLSDSAARGGDLSAHNIYLFTSGMPCISWGNVRLPSPFATFTGGQSPNVITALPKGFNPEDVSIFTSEPPRVYWCHHWQSRTDWKEARNCRNASPLCRICKC